MLLLDIALLSWQGGKEQLPATLLGRRVAPSHATATYGFIPLHGIMYSSAAGRSARDRSRAWHAG